MIDWISVCAVIISTACAILCIVSVVVCYHLNLREQNRRVISGGDHVRPSQPWPKPRPAPAVAPLPAPVEQAQEPEVERPHCNKCGEQMDGPVRMDVVDGESVYVFSCACGQQLDVSV